MEEGENDGEIRFMMERSIDGEGSIVLDVDHGLYSPPQLSNNIQSVFIVQSP